MKYEKKLNHLYNIATALMSLEKTGTLEAFEKREVLKAKKKLAKEIKRTQNKMNNQSGE